MECGAKERAWLASGYAVIEDDDMDRAEVLIIAGQVPIAVIPSWVKGPCREYMFGWCLAELLELRSGWLAVVQLSWV